MAESLAVGVQLASEADIARVWQGSGVQWGELIDSSQDVEQFVKDRKMEFTNTNDNTVAPEPSSSGISLITVFQILKILKIVRAMSFIIITIYYGKWLFHFKPLISRTHSKHRQSVMAE